MRIFCNELKKMLNFKMLLLLLILAGLFWYAGFGDSLGAFESLKYHGSLGGYQTELYEKYGATLEPEELAEFDIDGKIAEQVAIANAIIAANPIFAEYGVYNLEDWRNAENMITDILGDLVDLPDVKIEGGDFAITVPGRTVLAVDSPEQLDSDFWEMYGLLNGGDEHRTLDDWYNSPIVRLENLNNIRHQYVNYGERLASYVERSPSPIERKAAEKLIQNRNSNLSAYHLPGSFSEQVGFVAAISACVVLFMICPVIAGDRRLGIHLLAYSSKAGRKIFRVQFLAAITASLIVSIGITAISWIPYFTNGQFEYWNAPIMSYSIGRYGILLYDITFGQYAILLTITSILMSVAAASTAFLLSRFSANSVAALIKAIPAGAILVLITLVITWWFGFEDNLIFTNLFGGQVAFPESWFAILPTAIILGICIWFVRKERRVDIL